MALIYTDFFLFVVLVRFVLTKKKNRFIVCDLLMICQRENTEFRHVNARAALVLAKTAVG